MPKSSSVFMPEFKHFGTFFFSGSLVYNSIERSISLMYRVNSQISIQQRRPVCENINVDTHTQKELEIMSID